MNGRTGGGWANKKNKLRIADEKNKMLISHKKNKIRIAVSNVAFKRRVVLTYHLFNNML